MSKTIAEVEGKLFELVNPDRRRPGGSCRACYCVDHVSLDRPPGETRELFEHRRHMCHVLASTSVSCLGNYGYFVEVDAFGRRKKVVT